MTNIPAINSFQLDATLDDVQFTVKDIESILSKLDISKCPGTDGFHSRVLKETCQQISKPLQIIFNRLFEGGDVPARESIKTTPAVIIIIIIIIMILLSEMENLFAQLIVGPAATEQRQIDVALSLSNVERQTG